MKNITLQEVDILSNNRVFSFILGLFFSSLLLAGGRRAKVEQVSAQMRLLSASEIREILEKFPEMVPDMFKAEVFEKGDTLSMVELFSFTEVEGIPILKNLFPRFHFYKGLTGTLPPYPYLMAVGGNKRYSMPSGFNHLLLESGLEVTERNIIELAKAFVILAVGSEPVFGNLEWGQAARRRPRPSLKDELLSFPQITFLEGRRSMDKKKSPPIYRVYLKVRVNEEIQIYGFHIRYGQILWATMNVEGKTSTKYFDFEIIEEPPKRGELDLQGQINIATASPSKAYVEWEGSKPHYYLIIESNGQATNNPVKFELSGFRNNQPNIAILVRCVDSAYADTLLFQPVVIDSNGNGSFLWTPNSQKTCITRVWAIDTVTKDSTPSKNLTLQKVITGRFLNNDIFGVYFCDQFFVNHLSIN